MADTAKTPKRIKIEEKEYVEMKQTVETLKKQMEEADSDIAYQGYRRAWVQLSNYYQRATTEILAVERTESRKEARAKRQTRVQKSRSAAS